MIHNFSNIIYGMCTIIHVQFAHLKVYTHINIYICMYTYAVYTLYVWCLLDSMVRLEPSCRVVCRGSSLQRWITFHWRTDRRRGAGAWLVLYEILDFQSNLYSTKLKSLCYFQQLKSGLRTCCIQLPHF